MLATAAENLLKDTQNLGCMSPGGSSDALRANQPPSVSAPGRLVRIISKPNHNLAWWVDGAGSRALREGPGGHRRARSVTALAS